MKINIDLSNGKYDGDVEIGVAWTIDLVEKLQSTWHKHQLPALMAIIPIIIKSPKMTINLFIKVLEVAFNTLNADDFELIDGIIGQFPKKT